MDTYLCCFNNTVKNKEMKVLNMKRKRLAKVLPIVIGVLLSSCGGQKSKGDIEVADGEALAAFDYFHYTGEDDYYNEHPLTNASQFYNPVLPGFYPDPSVCSNGDDYFLVTSTFVYYPGVPIFHSKDMINWKQIGHVLDRPSQMVNMQGQGVSGGIFAPAISYNPHNKTYYMITTNVGAGNFFVKTKDPFGSWSDPIYLPEVGGIDPSFFFDDDGRAYIVNNDGMDGKELYDGHRSIRVHEFDVKNDKTIGKTKMLVNGGVNLAEKPIWIEAPHLYKINGKYYLMAAEGGTGPAHSEVIFTGDSPMGTFTPWGKNPILTQRHLSPDRKDPITCAGHADLIQTKEGDWWAVFLACRPIDNRFENLGRETFMLPVHWSEDGFPYMTSGDELVSMTLERNGVQRQDDVTFGNFEWKDNFESDTLPLEWITLRAPADDFYSLDKHPGYLSLSYASVLASEKKTPAYIARRVQHHKFTSETRIQCQMQNEKQAAGMLVFKDENHHFFLAVKQTKDGQAVSLIKAGKEGEQTLADASLKDKSAVNLKVVSTGLHLAFYYAVKEGDWKLLMKDVDAGYLSSTQAGGFTGTTIGLYAVTYP